MKSFLFITAAGVLSTFVSAANAATCKIDQNGFFPSGNVIVRLAREPSLKDDANFAVFKAPLAVNTDGSPTSYHPDDFKGERLAINRIDNGIAISRADGGPKLTVEQKRHVFDQCRSSPTWRVPSGYKIIWQNVTAADSKGNPCIFKDGEYSGYFGSLTALKNGLKPTDAGECYSLNQLDLREVPATVLRGGAANPLQTWGARKGDLVLAINPITNVSVPAVIGDTGDADRIGEGSVALNMQLLGKSEQPKTYSEAKKLDTGTSRMIVVTFTGTSSYKRETPYSAGNIAARVETWAKEKYGSLGALKSAIIACTAGL